MKECDIARVRKRHSRRRRLSGSQMKEKVGVGGVDGRRGAKLTALSG